jgi:hypothetical protein
MGRGYSHTLGDKSARGHSGALGGGSSINRSGTHHEWRHEGHVLPGYPGSRRNRHEAIRTIVRDGASTAVSRETLARHGVL